MSKSTTGRVHPDIGDSHNNNSHKPMAVDIEERVFGSRLYPPNVPVADIGNKPVPKLDVHMIANETNHDRQLNLKIDEGNIHNDVETFTQPLLEPDRNRPSPPLAGPEIDDLDDEEAKPPSSTSTHGIDDGLLEPVDKPNGNNGHDFDGPENGEDDPNHVLNEGHDTDDGNLLPNGVDEPDIHDFGNRFGLDDRGMSPFPGSIPDVNTYQQKKNLAQGMMDLALLTANANQFRYVLDSNSTHPYYYVSLIFISLSIVFQVAVGVGLILNSRYNVKDDKDICKADKINNLTVLGVFLITVVNVFITAFSVVGTQSATPNTEVQVVGRS